MYSNTFDSTLNACAGCYIQHEQLQNIWSQLNIKMLYEVNERNMTITGNQNPCQVAYLILASVGI